MKPKTIRTTITLPWNIYQELRIRAVKERRTMSELLLEYYETVKRGGGGESKTKKLAKVLKEIADKKMVLWSKADEKERLLRRNQSVERLKKLDW